MAQCDLKTQTYSWLTSDTEMIWQVTARAASEMRLHRLGDFFRRHLRRRALYHLSITPDQKLGEVPGDVLFTLIVGETRLEKLVDLAGSVAIDVDLRKHREGRPVFRSRELENFGVSSGFLRTELIARKTENAELIVVVV